MSLASQAQERTLIALIADEDTSTGLLLAGIGHIASTSTSSSSKKGDSGAGHGSSTQSVRQGGGGGGGGGGANVGGLMGDSDKAAQVGAQCAERNFFIVNSQTGVAEIEAAFQSFTQERGDIAILLITQPLAEKIRQVCDRYTQAFPAVLEIPSKDAPYDPSKDSILKRVQKLFGE